MTSPKKKRVKRRASKKRKRNGVRPVEAEITYHLAGKAKPVLMGHFFFTRGEQDVGWGTIRYGLKEVALRCQFNGCSLAKSDLQSYVDIKLQQKFSHKDTDATKNRARSRLKMDPEVESEMEDARTREVVADSHRAIVSISGPATDTRWIFKAQDKEQYLDGSFANKTLGKLTVKNDVDIKLTAEFRANDLQLVEIFDRKGIGIARGRMFVAQKWLLKQLHKKSNRVSLPFGKAKLVDNDAH